MADRVEMDDDGNLKISRPKISGKIKLTYNEATEAERALEVDADAYMAELRGQVRAHRCLSYPAAWAKLPVSFVVGRGAINCQL